MDAPSFLYSALDPDTLKMAVELENLGGGDAKAVAAEVHAIVDDRLGNSSGIRGSSSNAQVVWLDRHGAVGLRDVSMPSDAPAAEALRYYPTSTAHRLHDVLRRPAADFALVHDLSQWVFRGFNVCVVGYGERLAGKTAAFFGFDGQLPAMVANLDAAHRTAPPASAASAGGTGPGLLDTGGLAINVLRDLYLQEAAAHDGATIALSAWTLSGPRFVDLLAPSASAGATAGTVGALEFVSVHCPTYAAALKARQDNAIRALPSRHRPLPPPLQVLLAARSRAPGARAHAPDAAVRERDRAHFFLRVLLHRPGPGTISHLHLVDLIGTAPMDDAPPGGGGTGTGTGSGSGSGTGAGAGAWRHLPEEDRVARRDHALQLQALGKVRMCASVCVACVYASAATITSSSPHTPPPPLTPL